MTVDELLDEIGKLSNADFSRLARCLGLTAPPEQQWALVEFDDNNENPIAIIEYMDGSKHRIDIFAAIRSNNMCIAHPIVLLAIYRWQRILQIRPALKIKDPWCEREDVIGEYIRDFRERYISGFPDSAAKHLSNLGKLLIEAVSGANRISMDVAVAAQVRDHGYDREDTLLYAAFEWLKETKKNRNNNNNIRLQELEIVLRKTWVRTQSISIQEIMEFFHSPQGTSYLYPKSWLPLRNAFIAWRFGLDHDALTQYLSRARKKEEEIKRIDTSFFSPSVNRYDLSEIGSVLMRYALSIPNEAYVKDTKGGREVEIDPSISAGIE